MIGREIARRRDESANIARKDAWNRLHVKVDLMGFTGMRPTEANNVRWGDYKARKDPRDEKTYTDIFVHGKGKERTLTTSAWGYHVLDYYRKNWRPNAKDSDYIFTNSRGKQSTRDNDMFAKVLTDLGLLKDKKGNNRTLYSLRHTYATDRLLDGNLDWDTLALNMGTSTKMIRDHYGHVIPQQKSAEITFSSQYELVKKKQAEARKKRAEEKRMVKAAESENVVLLDHTKNR